MARIGLNITVTGLSGKLIIRWVKASAPLAEVGRSDAFNYPYDAVYTINDLNRVVYIVQLWRSDDGVSLDQLIKDWSIDASLVNVVKFDTFQYKVGRGWDNTTPVATGPEVWADPVDGDTSLTDERLDGIAQNDLAVHEAGYGRKLNEEYELLAGGGITLLGGATFNQDTPWFIQYSTIDTISIGGGPGQSAGMFDGVEILTADQDFDDVTTPLANKLVIANWAGSVGTITYPDLSLIADGTHVTFNTHGGSQKYLVHQFDAGDSVKFLNQDLNVIYQAKNQKLSFYFFGGECYVIDHDIRMSQRGQVVFDYDNSRAADSGALILADESTGELLESDYPGLYAFVEALPSGTVALGTSSGQWSYDSGGGVYPNKRFFGIQTSVPKKIRVPHLSGVSPKFGTIPGTYEADNVGSFSGNLAITKGYSYTGAPNNNIFGNGSNNPQSMNMPFSYTPAITETRVKSFAQIPYIIL